MFILFSGDDYYPGGGAEDADLVGSTILELYEEWVKRKLRADWAHIAHVHSLGLDIVRYYKAKSRAAKATWHFPAIGEGPIWGPVDELYARVREDIRGRQ